MWVTIAMLAAAYAGYAAWPWVTVACAGAIVGALHASIRNLGDFYYRERIAREPARYVPVAFLSITITAAAAAMIFLALWAAGSFVRTLVE